MMIPQLPIEKGPEDHDDGLNDRSCPSRSPPHSFRPHQSYILRSPLLAAERVTKKGAGFEMTIFNSVRFYTAFAQAKTLTIIS